MRALARLPLAPRALPGSLRAAHSFADAPPPFVHLPLSAGGSALIVLSVAAGVGLAISASTRSSPPPPPPPPPLPPSAPLVPPSALQQSLSRPRQLVAFGSNRYGQLLLGDETDRFAPTVVALPDEPVCISAASKSSAVVLKDGRLMVSGAVNDGRLGMETNHVLGVLSSPISLLPPGEARYVALGELGGAVISPEGRLVVFGKLKGLDTVTPVCPVLPGKEARMRTVARGRSHLLVLDVDGNVIAMGDNSQGALGLGHRDAVLGAHRIPELSRVVSVACGRDFSLAATESGAIYSFGSDEHGVLGHAKSERRVLSPRKVDFNGHATMVAAGDSHALVLCKDGSVWSVGLGMDGQLGSGQRDDHSIFIRVELPGPARKVSCGAGHSAALLRDGTLYLWGRGDSGQLGRGSSIEAVAGRRLLPVRCDALRENVVDVELGGDHTLVLIEQGF